jgi:hypothetical protein
MKPILRVFPIVHACMAALFALCALMLVVVAVKSGWVAVAEGIERGTTQAIIETVGILAAAVVALQIAQTITEEEVLRDAHVSGPTRVRRFLSRFLVVVVVAMVVEGLVAIFRAANEDAVQLVYVAGLMVSAGALLAGWGFFIRMNVDAEKLEPEAMAEAKREDRKLRQ